MADTSSTMKLPILCCGIFLLTLFHPSASITYYKDMCKNVSEIMKPPFYLSSPDYPASFTFDTGTICNCRMYTVEPYNFSLEVIRFQTELRDGLSVAWHAGNSTGTKYVISETGKNASAVVPNVKDLTISFKPVKDGSGTFLIGVASARTDHWNKTIQVSMNLVCQDRPFEVKSEDGKRLTYILFNAIPIALMTFFGLIVIMSLLCGVCFGKEDKKPPSYRLGAVDPTMKVDTGPGTSGLSPIYENPGAVNKNFDAAPDYTTLKSENTAL